MSTCKTLLRICPSKHQPSLLPLTQCRHESTTRRHKKLLALPEAPSYTPSNPHPVLVFNPPSSAPNVYHTPLKFLPKTDKRRQLYAQQLAYTTLTSRARQTSPIASAGTPLHTTSAHLPPRPNASLPAPLRAPYEKKYHLTDTEIAEIRRLRTEDAYTWTRVKLAERFGCSQFFVGMVVKNVGRAEEVRRSHDGERKKWGVKRREAREDRERRKEGWGRDA